MKWIYLTIAQSSLFSLRPSATTSSGGVSLLVPTPYAIKMALIDIYCRHFSQQLGIFGGGKDDRFNAIRDLEVRIKPPDKISVSGGIVNVRRPPHDKKKTKEPFIPTIAYREYVHWQKGLEDNGEMIIAFGVNETSSTLKVDMNSSGLFVYFPELLESMLLRINYIGKRGGFVQPVKVEEAGEPGDDFSKPYDPDEQQSNGFIIQQLDDMGKKITFAKVSPYNKAELNVNEHERNIVPTVLPLKLRRASPKMKVFIRTV
ncbi:MAG: hypothetical protein ACOC80_14360 [Petrotogales bacterium]